MREGRIGMCSFSADITVCTVVDDEWKDIGEDRKAFGGQEGR